jgi:hypothetical protein
MGPTSLANNLISSLKIGGGLNLSLEDHVSWLSKNAIPKSASGNMQNAKIAIIGMAGRFPNAADHEAFWKLLEQGLDVHREVRYDPLSQSESFVDMSRFPRTASMLKPTLIQVERARTKRTLLMDVSLMILGCSTRDFSICHRGRLNKQIQCSDWLFRQHMRPWKWPDL